MESIEGSTATQWNFRSFCDFGDADITNKGRSIVAKVSHKLQITINFLFYMCIFQDVRFGIYNSFYLVYSQICE